jgi:hypothetical protein
MEMKRLLLLVAIAFALGAGAAYADESCANVATTTGGTTVLAASANKGNAIMCQNLGGTNAATCSVGGTPVAAQHGILLAVSGGNVTLQTEPVTQQNGSGQSRLPSGAVSCITGSSTTYVCCESW